MVYYYYHHFIAIIQEYYLNDDLLIVYDAINTANFVNNVYILHLKKEQKE